MTPFWYTYTESFHDGGIVSTCIMYTAFMYGDREKNVLVRINETKASLIENLFALVIFNRCQVLRETRHLYVDSSMRVRYSIVSVSQHRLVNKVKYDSWLIPDWGGLVRKVSGRVVDRPVWNGGNYGDKRIIVTVKPYVYTRAWENAMAIGLCFIMGDWFIHIFFWQSSLPKMAFSKYTYECLNLNVINT